MAKNFIGYGLLEEWARSVDASRPVYAGGGRGGARLKSASPSPACSRPAMGKA